MENWKITVDDVRENVFNSPYWFISSKCAGWNLIVFDEQRIHNSVYETRLGKLLPIAGNSSKKKKKKKKCRYGLINVNAARREGGKNWHITCHITKRKHAKIEEAAARVISASFYPTNYLSIFGILRSLFLYLCFFHYSRDRAFY